MGVDLGGIVLKENRKLTDFQGRTIGVDAYNALYQFISIIRQPDGTPLTDSNGGVTSHLTGLLYRTANLVEAGIKPVYVFDGKPSPLKMTTLEDRGVVRNKAAEEWKKMGGKERDDLTKRLNNCEVRQVLRQYSKNMNEMKKMGLYVDVKDDAELVTTPNNINKDFVRRELNSFEIELSFFEELYCLNNY
ncbi:hypothetical protein FP804_00905 [archaeon]|nr:hypothetical protein [archaeon]